MVGVGDGTCSGMDLFHARVGVNDESLLRLTANSLALKVDKSVLDTGKVGLPLESELISGEFLLLLN